MKKIIGIAMLALLCVAHVFGSETRVFSMGQVGPFIYDNSNIALFPGAVMRYGNEVVTELRWKDTESSFSAEVRLPINSDYMIGLNFNRPITTYIPLTTASVELNETSDLYLGTHFAGHDVGLRLSLGRDGFSEDSTFGNPKVDESARYLELAGGISSDRYDLAGSLELPSVTSEQGKMSDKWSGLGLNFNGRYFHQLNEKMQIVPVVQMGLSSSSRKLDYGTAQPDEETDYGILGLNLGVGVHYKIKEGNTLILAIDPFGYYRIKYKLKDVGETTITTVTLPRLYLGGEAAIKSWLVGRIGAYRAYQTITTKNKPDQGDAVESSVQQSPYNVSFGLGMKLGNFLIDIDINDGLLFEGPNFISGQSRDMVNRVSVSYLFSNHERSKK